MDNNLASYDNEFSDMMPYPLSIILDEDGNPLRVLAVVHFKCTDRGCQTVHHDIYTERVEWIEA